MSDLPQPPAPLDPLVQPESATPNTAPSAPPTAGAPDLPAAPGVSDAPLTPEAALAPEALGAPAEAAQGGEAAAGAASPGAASPDAAAPDASTPEAAPAKNEQTPAQCSALLKAQFPALFGGAFKPLKLRIQADIQARAPGLFSRRALGAFFHRYTGSTGYLIALTKHEQRFDLDGQPAGELSEEHRTLAREELQRRRALTRERERQAGGPAAAGGNAPGAEGATAPGRLPRGERPGHGPRGEGGGRPGQRPQGAQGPREGRPDRPPRRERPAPAGSEASGGALTDAAAGTPSGNQPGTDPGAQAVAARPPTDRGPRPDRAPRQDRGDRSVRGDQQGPRGERAQRPPRADGPPRGDRPAQPGGRGEGGPRGDRPGRGPRPGAGMGQGQGLDHRGQHRHSAGASGHAHAGELDATPSTPLSPEEAALRDARRHRASLLRDFERSPFSLASFCALKGLKPEELSPLLDQARKEAAERPPRPR